RLGSRRVGVEGKIHALGFGVTHKQSRLLLGKSGAECGNRVRESELMRGYRVKIALDNNDGIVGFYRLFGKMKGKEVLPFCVDWSFRRIDVFDLIVAQCSATKCDDTPLLVAYGNHQTVPEKIVITGGFRLSPDQARLLKCRAGDLQGGSQIAKQAVPGVCGISEAEFRHNLVSHSPLLQVLSCNQSFFRVLQKLLEISAS